MNVIVSVTTTKARLNLFYYALQSLKRQNYERFNIVVNLSKEPYLFDEGIDTAPEWMNGDNVQVDFVRNLGPYRKLIPLIESVGAEDLLVTADDDLLYSEDWLRSLVGRAIEDPRAVICSRARVIKRNFFGRFQNYESWGLCEEPKSGIDLMPTGCAGIVYRRALLDMEFLRDEAYLKCAPTADDIWFRIASLRKNTPVFVDPEIDKRNGYIHHFMGLEEVNRNRSRRARRLYTRLLKKSLEKSRNYFGIPSCKNDEAWRKSLEYSRFGAEGI